MKNKITITIEDMPDGTVKVVSNPTADHMIIDVTEHRSTAAQGYALGMLNRAREMSRDISSNLIVKVPRVGRH